MGILQVCKKLSSQYNSLIFVSLNIIFLSFTPNCIGETPVGQKFSGISDYVSPQGTVNQRVNHSSSVSSSSNANNGNTDEIQFSNSSHKLNYDQTKFIHHDLQKSGSNEAPDFAYYSDYTYLDSSEESGRSLTSGRKTNDNEGQTRESTGSSLVKMLMSPLKPLTQQFWFPLILRRPKMKYPQSGSGNLNSLEDDQYHTHYDLEVDAEASSHPSKERPRRRVRGRRRRGRRFGRRRRRRGPRRGRGRRRRPRKPRPPPLDDYDDDFPSKNADKIPMKVSYTEGPKFPLDPPTKEIRGQYNSPEPGFSVEPAIEFLPAQIQEVEYSDDVKVEGGRHRFKDVFENNENFEVINHHHNQGYQVSHFQEPNYSPFPNSIYDKLPPIHEEGNDVENQNHLRTMRPPPPQPPPNFDTESNHREPEYRPRARPPISNSLTIPFPPLPLPFRNMPMQDKPKNYYFFAPFPVPPTAPTQTHEYSYFSGSIPYYSNRNPRKENPRLFLRYPYTPISSDSNSMPLRYVKIAKPKLTSPQGFDIFKSRSNSFNFEGRNVTQHGFSNGGQNVEKQNGITGPQIIYGQRNPHPDEAFNVGKVTNNNVGNNLRHDALSNTVPPHSRVKYF